MRWGSRHESTFVVLGLCFEVDDLYTIRAPIIQNIIYIMFERDICEKYQSRNKQFPEPKVEGNLVSRLVFFRKYPSQYDISV